MDKASKDVLFMIALDLSLPELLNWCLSSKRVNQKVCQNRDVWISKLKRDFSDEDISYFKNVFPSYSNQQYQELYKFLYGLNKVKIFLTKLNVIKSNYSLIQLYERKKLDLRNYQLKDLPKELGLLTNLQRLYLYNNQLKDLPKELGQLTNLQIYK